MKLRLVIAAVFFANIVNAQLKEGKNNINSLCGCFEVEFKYAETFSPDTSYSFHDREIINGGIELILPIEVSDKKIVLQHLLVVNDKVIVKHWREDWAYEDASLLKYEGDLKWVKTSVNNNQEKGTWKQSVWEVSEAPRYQGTGTWININGEQVWQNNTDAPLPRREYTVRNDYNVMNRTNRIRITEDGWIHEQDNRKIIRNGGKDKLIAEEKGINSYVRVDDSKCAPALAYWEKTSEYWAAVKSIWDNYLSTHNNIQLKSEINGRSLYTPLFGLANEYASGTLPKENLTKAVNNIMKPYLAE